MNEQNKRIAYIGIIHNENLDLRTLVNAVSVNEALNMVFEKYKDSPEVRLNKEDITIVSFQEGYK